MEKQAAPPARGDAPVYSEIDWSFTDSETLVRAMLKKLDGAWLEFLRRADPLVTEGVGRAVRRCHVLPSTELVSDVRSDVLDHLRSDNMRALRAFDPRHGTLATWIRRVAEQLTLRRLAELTLPRGSEEK